MRKLSLAAFGVSAALATAIAGAATVPTPATAAEKIKCYGIAKAGENDCANKAAGHSCAGQSTVDFNGMDFKAVTKAKCLEMGGKEKPFEGINKNVKN
ncbi:Uncharacterized membrane protein [Tistlia consotensis]|uniref:Uncharacterized membrane protein n=1 Tax=Tistlia consotensis USBA 355 TaxID=560819 RepID=A0A1Y6BY95_9PROT|nr:DUF2282 domain-containing protein [Tistlia consotensis]SMF26366.1 Uncharacterized membrane protein [Tistlia consotensis USBA 355]SNR67212.1 Uncharacterized membrane protein [Tistlia consotensis]